MAGGPWQGLSREVSWDDDVGLWNAAPEQQEPDDEKLELEPEPDWQDWKAEGDDDTFDDLADPVAIASPMKDIANDGGAYESLSAQLLDAANVDLDQDSGLDYSDTMTFNAPVGAMDAIAGDGAAPFPVMNPKECSSSESESGNEGDEEELTRVTGDPGRASTSFPSHSSSSEEEEEDLGSHTLYVQLGHEPTGSHPAMPMAPSPIEPTMQEDGLVHGVSEAQGHDPLNVVSGPFYMAPSPIGFKVEEDGSLFPTVPPPEVEAEESQCPSLPSLDSTATVDEISAPAPPNGPRDGGGANPTSGWLRTPQGRGKAVVRRGRPRPWSSEGREATRKRVKLDELYEGASPSMVLKELFEPPTCSSPLENPFSQEGAGRFLSADEAHETTILASELLAQLGSGDSVTEHPSITAVSEKTPLTTLTTPSKTMGNTRAVVGTLETASKPMERSNSMNRCSGRTLHGNQCTHNVKDGSGFCVKHTKNEADQHPNAADHAMLNGEGTGAGSGTPSTRGASSNPPPKPAEVILLRCRGRTLHGNQCTHNVKDGALYCMKHADQAWGTPSKRVEAKPPQQRPAQAVPNGGPVQPRTLTPQVEPSVTPTSSKETADSPATAAGGLRCIGRTRRTEDQCSFRPKSGSVFCERHSRQFRDQGSLDYSMMHEAVPLSPPAASAALKRRKSQDGMNKADKNGIRERKSLLRAKEWFADVLNAGLLHEKAVGANRKDLVGWICEEATKDAMSGETLLGLLSEEKERLRKVLIEDGQRSPRAKPVLFWGTKSLPEEEGTNPSVLKHIQTGCSKGGEEGGALTGCSSASPSSNAAGPSDSAALTPTQQWRQGSQPDRDILTCSLCNTKFLEMRILGKHWKEEHKKEAFLFQKGVACRACGQEYTNRGGLLRHWKSTHPTMPIDPGTIVCVLCDKTFPEFNTLWAHVEEQHALEFSSSDFARQVSEGILGAKALLKCSFCGEGFDTHWDLHHHKESVHKGQADHYPKPASEVPNPTSWTTVATANGNGGASPHKFKCRFCGERFNLLPDLGRHHQAEHRKPAITPPVKTAASPVAVEFKIPPAVGKRTPLPNPATASSPPGKMLPLSELCTTPPWKISVNEDPKISKVMTTMSSVAMTVEWPLPAAVEYQPQAVNFRQWKTLARERGKKEPPPLLPPPVVAVAPPKRRRRRKRMELLQSEKLLPVKKKNKQGGGAKQIVHHMKAMTQSQKERQGANGHVATAVHPASKMLPQRTANTTGWPTSAELLDAARVACCKDSLYRELAKKHDDLHPNLYLQAASLCTAMRVDTQWHIDGFVCPNKCLPFHATQGPVLPALEVDMAGFSEAPFKAHADLVTNPRSTPLETVDKKEVRHGKCTVMYEDLSNGQEPVPVPCVVDEDVLRPCLCASCRDNPAGNSSAADSGEPWKAFSYMNKRLLDPSLGLDTESSKLGCACGAGRCNPLQCEHVLMFDNDNVDARDKSGAAMRGRFPYDDQGRIILEDGYMVYECNSSCLCQDDCQNRVLQKGVQVKLEVFKSRHKGWAVRTAEPIGHGTFVCEYIGEVLNDQEANKRGERYDKDGCSYLYDIDAHLDVTGSRAGAKPFVIDATKHGNVARFINHSCDPNLVNYEVLVESMDCQLAHIGFFAKRDIAAGEELAYNYRYKLLPGKGCACHCGAATCRGRLY